MIQYVYTNTYCIANIDLHLSTNFYNEVMSASYKKILNLFTDYLENISQGKKYREETLKIVLKELSEDLENFKNGDDKVKEGLVLLRDLLGGSAWVSRSFARSMTSYTKLPKDKKRVPHLSLHHKEIIDNVRKKKPMGELKVSDAEIFSSILHETLNVHRGRKINIGLKVPSPKATIVLVDGVLNEIYKMANFQRACEHLNEKFDYPYFVAQVEGLDTCNNNAQILHRYILDRVKVNPEEKFWIIGFSKGGLDSLYFARNFPEVCNKHVIGISTIASPILGSPKTEHKIIKILNNLDEVFNFPLIKNLFADKEFQIRGMQLALSEEHQKSWLQRNKDKFPKKPFYTSLALRSHWRESHIYMIFTKLLFQSTKPNDGVVDLENANFPEYFTQGTNLGFINGHHLIGSRSSTFEQEALIEALAITLDYLGKF